MRILHTSDWHLGKYLDSYSRLDEQRQFIDELVEIVERQSIDFIIIAGDIYDTLNPPAAAEQLFYKSMKRLSNGGKRPVLVIAGNHDSHSRLTASSPLATELGIILVGKPDTVVAIADYEHFSVVNSGEGFFELAIKQENMVVITMPYPSETRLNELISASTDEKEIQKSYSQKIGEIFDKSAQFYRKDSINIAVGHFYVVGGETSKSERDIALGGSYAVSADMLPDAQYIAMGHLHRPQKVAAKCKHAYYSGSPIQYGKSEAAFAKCVYIAEIKAGKEPAVTKIPLRNYKPIAVWKVKSIAVALEMCEAHKNENSWVFLEIETDRVLLQSEIKQLRQTKSDIVEIFPVLPDENETLGRHDFEEKSLKEEFQAFYLASRHVLPTDEMVELFLTLCGKEVEHEADFIEN